MKSTLASNVSPHYLNCCFNNRISNKNNINIIKTGENRSQTQTTGMSSAQLINLVSLPLSSSTSISSNSNPKKNNSTVSNTICNLASPDDADTFL